MKENLRRLELIFKLTRLKPEMFYSISFCNSRIVMQGYTDKLHNVCSELKFEDQNNCIGTMRRFMRNGMCIEIIKA